MPLGLLALGSWLSGEHVVVVDGRFELAPEARIVELARGALCLGVTVRTGAPMREALRVSAAARAARPDLAVVWGGPHATAEPAACLETGVVDACVAGAGEDALAAAASALRAGHPLRSVAGLVDREGGMPRRPPRPPTSGRGPTTRCSTSSGTSSGGGRGGSTTARAGARGMADSGWASAPSAW